jgi:hypothetical protein
MGRTDIDNPWRDENDEPEELSAWIAVGFTETDAEVWRRWRFHIAEAHAWRRAGVTEGLHAAQWSTAKVTPATVGEWQASGIDATEAVAWHEFGYDLERAREFKRQGLTANDAFQQAHQQMGRAIFSAGGPGGSHPMARLAQAGVPPQVLHSYATRQWFDEDAIAWARESIDAAEAQIWKSLGLTPLEAARLSRQGHAPADVIKSWWTAGIPFDELAAWIGAGLTADEAAEQRARGITAEQAATLRALRQGEDDE